MSIYTCSPPTAVDIQQEGVGWAWQYIPGIQKARGEGRSLATHGDSVLKAGWREARQVFEQQKPVWIGSQQNLSLIKQSVTKRPQATSASAPWALTSSKALTGTLG